MQRLELPQFEYQHRTIKLRPGFHGLNKTLEDVLPLFLAELQADLEEIRARERVMYTHFVTPEMEAIEDPENDPEISNFSSIPVPVILAAQAQAVYSWLHENEVAFQPLPTFDLTELDQDGWMEFDRLVQNKLHFIRNEKVLLEGLADALKEVVDKLRPAIAGLPKGPGITLAEVPLYEVLPDARQTIDVLIQIFTSYPLKNSGVCTKLWSRLGGNVLRLSKVDMFASPGHMPRSITATKSGHSLSETVTRYFEGTPFVDLLSVPVPLRLLRDERMNHTHIVGGTGAGKTSLIEKIILHDIQSEDPPSIVLIDPHGDLIRELTRADLGIEDRLIIIDPRDVKNPPALNVFALNKERLDQYDDATREQVTAGVIDTFDYLFAGLIGAELTAKQGVFFRFTARLMLALPEAMGRNATILDIMHLMDDATPYREAIESLDPIPRAWFKNDFQSKTFQQTKEQIRYRLQSIVENPTMARLFTSPETKVDLFNEMNRGAIILVDTASDFLKGASDNFGRVFISLVLQAVLERSAIPQKQRKDTFLIVDEAASYFDGNIDDLLTDARKYRCGLVLAHQYLDQATSSLKSSLAANTGTKFVGGVAASDARAMASDLKCAPEFIMEQPKLHFATHIRNVTHHAVSVPVEPGLLSRQPKLSAEAYATLMARNRAKVSLQAKPPREQPVSTPDEDISPDWR